MSRHFTKEDIWVVNKYLKTVSTPLVTREMQIKVIVIYLYPVFE